MAKPFQTAQRTDYQSLWTKLLPANGARQWYSIWLDCGWLLLARLLLKMEVLLKAAQVDDLLDEITTSSDAEASKPSPDIVEAANWICSLTKFWCWWHTYDIKLPVRLESVWLLYTLRAMRGSGDQGDLMILPDLFGSLRRFAARQNRIEPVEQGAIMFPAKLAPVLLLLRFVRNEFNNKTQTIFRLPSFFQPLVF